MSGVQNGVGYSKNEPGLKKMSIVLAVLIIIQTIFFWAFTDLFDTVKIVSSVLMLVSLICVFGAYDSFVEDFNTFPTDIHLFEMGVTGGVTLAWIGMSGNLIMIAASVYPALILHKGFINLGSGLDFFDNRTDDPTGKTFSIPLLGIKIPRIGTTVRIALAAISVAIAIVAQVLHWSIRINF